MILFLSLSLDIQDDFFWSDVCFADNLLLSSVVIFVSRFINGSTALHTAAYFGIIPIIQELLNTGLDINILDYKGATSLHRAKDTSTMKVNTLSSG